MKRLLRAVAWLALTSVGTHATAHKLWFEAETGAEYSPLLVKADPAASQRIYLASSRFEASVYRTERNGRVAFEVYVPAAGTYTLWARTRIPWANIEPYDVSFGNGNVYDHSQWQRWAPDTRPATALSSWEWSHSGISVELPQGASTLHLIPRAGGPGVHLDKLLLTDELEFVPAGLGEAEPGLPVEHDFQSSVVRHHGQLRVEAGRLVDQHQQPVQLRGISSHGLQWFPLADNQTIPYLAQWLKVDVVRLAMYVEEYSPSDGGDYWGGYMADPQFMRAKLIAALEDAIAAGVYVVVDWHIHNTPQRFLSEAVTFFDDIARRYGHYPHLIYEICNEPTGVSWSGGIKPYAEKVINTIRRHDPDNLIIVGTPNWSQDVEAAVQDPLSASNVMYAMHYYAGSHDFATMRAKLDTALDAGLAVFVSEWGASDVNTTYINLPVATQWVEYLNRRGVSWINWSLGNKDEASSVLRPAAPLTGPWDSSDLTDVGRWLQPYLLEPRNGTPPPVDPPPVDPPPVDPPPVDPPPVDPPPVDPPPVDPPPVDPAPVLELSASASGPAVSLKWSVAGMAVRGFEIYRDLDPNPDGRARVVTIDAAVRRFADTSAARGVTYHYWVRAIGVDGRVAETPVAAATLALANRQAPVHGLLARVLSRHSGKALGVAQASQQPAAGLSLADAGHGADVYWQLERVGQRYRLRNRNSQQCLDVPDGTAADGAGLQQWWCHQQGPQLWEFVPRGDGFYAIRNAANDKCVTVAGFSPLAGAAITQWDCHYMANQLWRLEPRQLF